MKLPGGEPTNNRAERDLRPAVIARKVFALFSAQRLAEVRHYLVTNFG
jgi:hypothetical protein